MMILIFAQWCINEGVDPYELYKEAYPQQGANEKLAGVMKLTVPKDEAGPIEDDTVLGALSIFGNEDLAFAVTNVIANRKASKR
ncbi:hypothetical protein [Paenibacillus sediminis]|nr:hypothetical protein [Paenibacillus sediminis]